MVTTIEILDVKPYLEIEGQQPGNNRKITSLKKDNKIIF